MTLPAGIHYRFSNAEKITGQRRKEITQLLQEYKLDNFNRFGLGRNTGKRVLGVEAVKKYSKLIIFGKPGAGKTTFLKSVAFECIEGEFQAEKVPIFMRRDASHPRILFGGYKRIAEFIQHYYANCGSIIM